MKMIKTYLAYINDNPNGYWFRRKLCGWGWTPATKEGWFVTVVFIAFIICIGWRSDLQQLEGYGLVWQFIVPAVAATTLLVWVCFKTGEPPRWQCKIPKKYFH